MLPKGRGVYFDDPNFEVALKNQEQTAMSRGSGRSRRAALVFQSSPHELTYQFYISAVVFKYLEYLVNYL